MTPDTADIASAVAARQPWMLSRLRQLVELESPSHNKAAVDRACDLVSSWAASLGARIKRHKQKSHGDLLELRFGPVKSRHKPIMLLGHLDTVWDIGTLARMPWREATGKLHGPGVYDMKSGVLMALIPILLLLVSDEEIGSPISRPVTEKLARTCSAVFVMEPAQGPQGAYKTARKGVGDYQLRVTGVPSHSGVDFEKGHSAILELMRLLARVETFTDLKRGLTVNPGVISGGTRCNVIAAEATAHIDVRIARASDAARLDKLFRSLRCTDKACKLTVTGGINRPPMERTPGTVALFKRAQKLAASVGFKLEEAATGGGSDGNFTSALGIPTLDGMGPIGEGAHAANESLILASLPQRTTLLAAMIASSI